MHHADVAVAVHVGDRGRRRPRDRVITTHHERHDVSTRHLGHPLLDVGETLIDHPVRTRGVAVIDDLYPVVHLESSTEVIGAGLIRVRAQRPGAETCTRTVGRAEIERRADDRDVGLPLIELRRFGQQRSLTECQHAAEVVALVELLLIPGRNLASRRRHESHGNAKRPGLRC